MERRESRGEEVEGGGEVGECQAWARRVASSAVARIWSLEVERVGLLAAPLWRRRRRLGVEVEEEEEGQQHSTATRPARAFRACWPKCAKAAASVSNAEGREEVSGGWGCKGGTRRAATAAPSVRRAAAARAWSLARPAMGRRGRRDG